MKILYYEMRKSWLKLSTFLMLVICAALNIYRIGSTSQNFFFTYGEFQEPYFRLYDTVSGKLDESKLAQFRSKKNELDNLIGTKMYTTDYAPEKYEYTGYAFGDYSLYNAAIAPEISYCATYSNISNQIAAKAVEGYYLYKENGNSYERKKSALIYELYQNRSIPEYRATNWTGEYFTYDFSSLLCVIMLILGLSSCFTNEKTSGMNSLITAYGKWTKSLSAKIISAAIYCFGLTIFFTILDLVFINHFLVIDGIDMPIYSAKMFCTSPFRFSFLTAVIICAGLRFLGLLVIALLIMFISKNSPNTVISIGASFAAVIALIFLSLISESVFNPIGLLTPKTYIRECDLTNLFGTPILSLYTSISAAAILCVAEVILIMAGRKRNAASRI